MKKLDNRGFAISTMLYGLIVVLMLLFTLVISTMAFNRKNSKDFVDITTEELESLKYNGDTGIEPYS